MNQEEQILDNAVIANANFTEFTFPLTFEFKLGTGDQEILDGILKDGLIDSIEDYAAHMGNYSDSNARFSSALSPFRELIFYCCFFLFNVCDSDLVPLRIAWKIPAVFLEIKFITSNSSALAREALFVSDLSFVS